MILEYQTKTCGKEIHHVIDDERSYFVMHPNMSILRDLRTLKTCWADNGQHVQVPYRLSAELYVTGTGEGHPGFIFNIQDDTNYDFVFFRLDTGYYKDTTLCTSL